MMKKLILLVLFFTTTIVIFSQELPTEPVNGFTFPIGSKFTIKLYAVDSIRFDYSIIEFEPFEKILNSSEFDSLFSESGQKGTIECCFCASTWGETEKERKENLKIVLLMKNWTDFALSYKSDIQREEDGEFEETSNIGIYPDAVGVEMWPYMIYAIGLYDFRKIENKKDR